MNTIDANIKFLVKGYTNQLPLVYYDLDSATYNFDNCVIHVTHYPDGYMFHIYSVSGDFDREYFISNYLKSLVLEFLDDFFESIYNVTLMGDPVIRIRLT